MIKFICIFFATIILYSCKNDEINILSKEYLKFEVLGTIDNSELINYIESNDSVEHGYKSKYFIWSKGSDQRTYISPMLNYLVVKVRNNSEYNCLCGIGYNGFLSVIPTVLLDSLFFAPVPGLDIHVNVGTCGTAVMQDTSVVIPSNSSRLFIVLQPKIVHSPSHFAKVGYKHNCKIVGNNNFPIDSINSEHLIKYFVSNYQGEIFIVERDSMGEFMCDDF
jgi:hypothetical protein